MHCKMYKSVKSHFIIDDTLYCVFINDCLSYKILLKYKMHKHLEKNHITQGKKKSCIYTI